MDGDSVINRADRLWNQAVTSEGTDPLAWSCADLHSGVNHECCERPGITNDPSNTFLFMIISALPARRNPCVASFAVYYQVAEKSVMTRRRLPTPNQQQQ